MLNLVRSCLQILAAAREDEAVHYAGEASHPDISGARLSRSRDLPGRQGSQALDGDKQVKDRQHYNQVISAVDEDPRITRLFKEFMSLFDDEDNEPEKTIYYRMI